MWARLGHWLSRPWAIALILGLVMALYALPLHMLNPVDITWLNRSDTLAHWLGWEQFRHSPLLQLPLGKSEFYGLERSSSIVFSDSIPLMALLLHPVEGLLPTPFQYLGLWSLLCFILQAYFGYRLSSLVLRPPAAAAATLLFLASAPMLNRIHVHTSLMSHWLLVAGLYYYFTDDRWRWRRWAILISVASLVHGYLFAMTTVLWLAHLGKIAALGGLRGGRRVVLAACGRAALVVLAVGTLMYLAGYFGVKGINYHLYGSARYDLRNPLCSYGIWSLTTTPLICGAKPADWDGQAWLGLGGLAALGIGCLALVVTLIVRRGRFDWSARVPRWPLLIACLWLVWFAATNQVVFAGKELFAYPLPQRWLDMAETFRASGRMIWPVFYAELFFILALFARAIPSRLHLWILAPLALYQTYDVQYGIKVVNSDIPVANRIHPLSSPAWDRLAEYDRLVGVPVEVAQFGWHDLVWQAARRGAATNVGYFNRSSQTRETNARAFWLRSLISGSFDPRTVYLLEDKLWEVMRELKGKDDVALTADGYHLLFPGGARFGLIDDLSPPRQALPLGGWRQVGEQGDGDGALLSGWSWEEPWGRWSDFRVAALSIAQPEGERGVARRVALHFVAAYPSRTGGQRYRILSQGQLLAEGGLGEAGGLIELTVPATLTGRGVICLELELPDATRMAADGRYLGVALAHLWMSSRPGEAPPPLPPPSGPQ